MSATTKPKSLKSDYLSQPFSAWINQSNLESNRYLKSNAFLDSFNEYMKSIIELHSMTKSVSYPVTAIASLLDKYNAEVLRAILEIQETPHEVVYRMDDVRLLHYFDPWHSDGSAVKYGTPLVIVYAPVNSYHIMDIRRGRSIVEHFVSAGFDVYLVDWGRQLNNKPSLSGYVNYIHKSIEQVKKITHSAQVNMDTAGVVSCL